MFSVYSVSLNFQPRYKKKYRVYSQINKFPLICTDNDTPQKIMSMHRKHKWLSFSLVCVLSVCVRVLAVSQPETDTPWKNKERVKASPWKVANWEPWDKYIIHARTFLVPAESFLCFTSKNSNMQLTYKNKYANPLIMQVRFPRSQPTINLAYTGNILFRDIADLREKNILTKNKPTKIDNNNKIRGVFFGPENSKFDF